ncbi:PREDICTED: uncharacterized protein LOC109592460 [Amphimedon queenslandica]|uniref:MIR domain-containing protein n=1 Tax=Amphimedon queenslandica TaxID=400682 RepID=A0AAN0K2F2_AMPQE|nr:PREDICTED: uncharacterized protein LOC109592460 [Amphimedon queenslandica]|eukprot:XP_019863457.1 PREDICTED: uncharacterized protein LOC109592460 [Amphimedon queenslandica]
MASVDSVADSPVLDGDVVLFNCLDASSFLYSKPLSSNHSDQLTIESSNKKFFMFELAAFCITRGKQTSFQKAKSKESEDSSQLMEIVYGSTVKLQHQISGKYLTVRSNNEQQTLHLEQEDKSGPDKENLFKIVPSHQKKELGNSLLVQDNVKLESISCSGKKIKFQYNPKENGYCPSLEPDGTMFSITIYCHKHALLSPNCIKSGSIVMLASVNFDGYISARGSFVSGPIIKEQSQPKVCLCKWEKRYFNIEPYSGETFFQLENIDLETNKGTYLLFGNKYRIKHIVTQQYITVTENEEVELSSKPKNDWNQFELHPSLEGDNQEIIESGAHVTFRHVATKKCLSFNVTLNENGLVRWSDLVLENGKANFEVLQVDKFFVQDVYQVVSMSLVMLEIHTKFNEEILINTLKDLKTSFTLNKNLSKTSVDHKTRLASMLRSFGMIDAMVTLIKKHHKDSCNKVCELICSSLQMYVENGSFRAITYLVEKDDLLKILVNKCSNSVKVLITLFNKYRGHINQRRYFPLFDKLNEKYLADPAIVELMCILTFNGKWIKWEIYEKIKENLIGMVSTDEVKGLIENLREYEANISTDRLCSTFVQVNQGHSGFENEAQNDTNHAVQAIEIEFKEKPLIHVLLMNILVFLIDYRVFSKEVNIMQFLTANETSKVNEANIQTSDFQSSVTIIKKKLALLSLKLLLKRSFNSSIKALIEDFKKFGIGEHKSSTHYSDNSVLISMEEEGDFMRCLLQENNMEEIAKNSKQIKARLREYFTSNQTCQSFNVKANKELCDILTGFMTDDDADIRLMSTELLYNIFRVEEIILSEAEEKIYFTCSTDEAYEEMKQLATMSDKKQLLCRMLRREITGEDVQQKYGALFPSIIAALERMTMAFAPVKGIKPNSISQHVAYSCGLFDVILECVLEYKDCSDLENSENDILERCFTLLQKMSRNYSKVSNKTTDINSMYYI